MRLVTTKVAVLNVAALIGLAGPIAEGLTPRIAFTGPPSTPVTAAAPPGPTAGNLIVAVPVVPAIESLPGLCGLLLEGTDRTSDSARLRELYSATGGSRTSAHAWCLRFIAGSLRTGAAAAVPVGI